MIIRLSICTLSRFAAVTLLDLRLRGDDGVEGRGHDIIESADLD